MKTAHSLPAGSAAKALTLQKPIAISKAPAAWFAPFYKQGSQTERDRELSAH